MVIMLSFKESLIAEQFQGNYLNLKYRRRFVLAKFHGRLACALKMAAFSLQLDLAIEVSHHFLVKEYGDLSFFSIVLNKFLYVK